MNNQKSELTLKWEKLGEEMQDLLDQLEKEEYEKKLKIKKLEAKQESNKSNLGKKIYKPPREKLEKESKEMTDLLKRIKGKQKIEEKKEIVKVSNGAHLCPICKKSLLRCSTGSRFVNKPAGIDIKFCSDKCKAEYQIREMKKKGFYV